MRFSRRQFLRGTSASLVAAAIPSLRAAGQPRVGAASHAGDLPLKVLTARAIDAAMSAGAKYADVRYNVIQTERWTWVGHGYSSPFQEVVTGVGVRALFDGYWGYMAHSGLVTEADMDRLGREATGEAKIGAKGKPRTVELAARPIVDNGSWTTPNAIDPFTVPWEEKIDFFEGLLNYIDVQPFGASAGGGMAFHREERTCAVSDGSYYTQTLFWSSMNVGLGVANDWLHERGGARGSGSFISTAGAGWEYVRDVPLEAHAERMIKQAEDQRRPVPAEVGRYDIVFDGEALAEMVNRTIGVATELDRAVGYEANAGGTSFLKDPLAMLGAFQVGSQALTITANRSMPRGAATVKWDDEGVEPDDAILVQNGVLTDFQTTRESASWLTPYYDRMNIPVRSHGGAECWNVNRSPVQSPHNLVVAPAESATSFEELCSGVKNGLAVLGGSTRADQQALNAESYGDVVYEISTGKLGRTVDGAVLVWRAPDFWKKLRAVGGSHTVTQRGIDRWDRWPHRFTHTVAAPAALVEGVAVSTNIRRTI